MNSTWTCAINHGSDQAWAIPVWQLLTPRVYTKHACAVTGATPAPTTTSPYLSKNGLAPLPPPPPPPLPPPTVSLRHLHRHTYFPTPNCFWKNFLIGFRNFFFFFTHRPCISVSGGSTCRWWNLSSLKSWWAFPSSHGCSSHTWLPEDFPGYNFDRFLLSVILHCNKMRQTYVLLVLF